MTRPSRRLPLPVCLAAALLAGAGAAGELRAVVRPAAPLLGDPPSFTPTGEFAPYGATVEVLEERSAGKERYAKLRLADPRKPLGWVKADGTLGHPKEFDPSMRPTDAVPLQGLSGTDLTMASIYNARGRYLKEQAAKLGVSAADLAAVLLVESRGRGFDDQGNVVTRFENHVFHRQWGVKHQEVFDRHFTFDPTVKHKGHTFRKSPSGQFGTFHLDNAKELEVLAFARSLDDTAALRSASYGAAQVMGFNHAKLGYRDVQSMHRDFSRGIRPQLDGMIAFIRGTKLCMEGLKARDYVKFARGYNGAGKEAEYSARIRAAAESYAKVTKGRKFAD